MFFRKKIIYLYLMISFSVFADVKFEPGVNKEALTISNSSIDSNIDLTRNILRIGKETDNFLICDQGRIFFFWVDLRVNQLSEIQSFVLSRVTYKDFLQIKLNEQVIFTGPYAGEMSIRYDKKYREKADGKEYIFFGLQQGENLSISQSSRTNSQNVNYDAKSLLKEGRNRLEISVGCGFRGGFEFDFNLQQRSQEKFICNDSVHLCRQGKEKRIVDGVWVEKDCWQYGYSKTCNFPSKDDCLKYINNSKCQLVSKDGCLLKDSYGNCVNEKHTYSCETPTRKHKILRPTIKQTGDPNKPSGLRCSGALPQVEIDESSDLDKDMPETMSKLSAATKCKGIEGNSQASAESNMKNFKVFNGFKLHCKKNIASFKNCCGTKGWGEKLLGMQCSQDEKDLADLRQKRLCKFVGRKNTRTLSLKTGEEHYFCCFNNTLDRIIQTDPRGRPMVKPFGYAENADCSGLTMDQLKLIDFNKLDYNDFSVEVAGKVKLPDVGEVGKNIENALSNVQNYDPAGSETETGKLQNEKSGMNSKLDSQLGEDVKYNH